VLAAIGDRILQPSGPRCTRDEFLFISASIISALRWMVSAKRCSGGCVSRRGAPREKAEKTLKANGADGISDIEGKVARVATSKLGNERVSNSASALSHDAVLEPGSVPLPVVTARIDRFIAEGDKGPYPRYGVSTRL
jgi:hypothetical protein